MKSMTEKTYGLRNRFTGGLARLLVETLDNDGNRVPPQYRLGMDHDDEAAMLFQVDTAEKAALVKSFNTPENMSSKSYPGWGVLDMYRFDVAEITKVTSYSVSEVDQAAPVAFARLIGQCATTQSKAENLLGHAIPDAFIGKPLSLSVAPVPAGETFDSLKEKCTGRFILVTEEDAHIELCVGVSKLPDQYLRLFVLEQGVGLICTRVPD